MEKEELLLVIEKLNEQVSQLNLENIVLRTKIDLMKNEKGKDDE